MQSQRSGSFIFVEWHKSALSRQHSWLRFVTDKALLLRDFFQVARFANHLKPLMCMFPYIILRLRLVERSSFGLPPELFPVCCCKMKDRESAHNSKSYYGFSQSLCLYHNRPLSLRFFLETELKTEREFRMPRKRLKFAQMRAQKISSVNVEEDIRALCSACYSSMTEIWHSVIYRGIR